MAYAKKSTTTSRKQSPAARRKPAVKSSSRRLSVIRKHAIDSLLGVAPHAHTGKRLHHRQTSHGFLLVALLFTGILLFSNLGALRAFGVTKAGSVNVSVNVLGAPPTTGAVITFPVTNSTTTNSLIGVSGTCPAQTLVSVYNNGIFAGSSTCSAGLFTVTVSVATGINILQAQNYDGLNQPGPVTPAVTILKENATIAPVDPVDVTPTTGTEVATTTEQVIPQTTPVASPLPATPAIPPDCSDLDESPINSPTPIIAVGCIHRNVFAGETLSMPLLIKGGLAPFALAVDWGDEKQDLVTILNNKKKVLSHTYETGGFHKVSLKATDSSGVTTHLHTTVSVNGEATTGAVVTGVDKVIEAAASIWVDAPVPLYFTALALAIGFWVGDVFQRLAAHPQAVSAHRHRNVRRHA